MRKTIDTDLSTHILIMWNIDDIKDRDPQNLLTDHDCCQILKILYDDHDANIGINWDVIDAAIEQFLSNGENTND